jgi:hypothetical protein
MTVRSDFNVIATELSTDPNADQFITWAAQEINPVLWKQKTSRATALLAAHELTMSKRGATGVGGMMGSEKVGDLEAKYIAPLYVGSEAPYGTTAYGQMFLRLRRTIVRGPIVLS